MSNTPDDYYKSKHWIKTRKQYLESYDCACALCGKKKYKKLKNGNFKLVAKRFTLHHLNYDHPYAETAKDLIPLCYGCHQLLHEILRRNPEPSTILFQFKETILSLGS